MEGTFTLTVELGNAAMSEVEDVAEELHRIAGMVAEGFTSGQAVDGNGNTVGWWKIEEASV